MQYGRARELGPFDQSGMVNLAKRDLRTVADVSGRFPTYGIRKPGFLKLLSIYLRKMGLRGIIEGW
jgi:hypothetical protein